jgi:lipoprotein-anchoring transpeptidase ErfK/SrfK
VNFMQSRRDFLKLSAVSLASLALRPRWLSLAQQDFPQADQLGRVIPGGVRVYSRPDPASTAIRQLLEDEIITVERRVVGTQPYRINQTWIETPEGYVWSPVVQPVKNQPNTPFSELPMTSMGEGMWVEVSVPFVNLVPANPTARAPWLTNRIDSGLPPRFFYGQVIWVDQIKVEDQQVFYRLNEKYGYGDAFWADAEGLRPLTEEELAPISPEVEEKRIRVDINNQTLSCFEGKHEVFFTRVSTGALYNIFGERVPEWGTPPGNHRIWRKAISLPLSGGSSAAGWDLPAVGWISLFVGTGVAFHSTFWHNNYGVPTSRGCVNMRPEDSKWLFRWTQPYVTYAPGDVTVGMPGGTSIEVFEA